LLITETAAEIVEVTREKQYVVHQRMQHQCCPPDIRSVVIVVFLCPFGVSVICLSFKNG